MMDMKQARKTAVEVMLKNSCNNYLYAYLKQRELQPDSPITNMQIEHSGYISELVEQQELDIPNAKIALDSFEMERKSTAVSRFWNRLEEESAIRSASLGHLNIFGKSLTQYALAQELQTSNKREKMIERTTPRKKAKNTMKSAPQPINENFSADYDDISAPSSEINRKEQRKTKNGRIIPSYKGLDMSTDECNNIDDTSYTLEENEITQEQQNDLTGISLTSIMEEYCEIGSTSKFDPAKSYILDLSSRSTISKVFTTECWSKLIADRPDVVNVQYHKEIDTILDYLFGKQIKNVQQARVQWENLRTLKAPEYKTEFSYGVDEWKKIVWWIESAVGRFLNAFENERNPLLQHDCHEREFLGGFLVPIFQGALSLDGRFRVPWGEVTVISSMQRRNINKHILEEKVDRGHLADLLCFTESYELLCLLACGGPHKVDLTKLASDEFSLPRLLKDTLDIL